MQYKKFRNQQIKWKNLFRRDIFRTLSNIYEDTFFGKIAFIHYLFLQESLAIDVLPAPKYTSVQRQSDACTSVGIYLFKVINGHQWRLSGVSFLNFEQI